MQYCVHRGPEYNYSIVEGVTLQLRGLLARADLEDAEKGASESYGESNRRR